MVSASLPASGRWPEVQQWPLLVKDFRCGPGCEVSACCSGGLRWKSSQGGSRGSWVVSMGIVCFRPARRLFQRFGWYFAEPLSEMPVRALQLFERPISRGSVP